MHFILTAIDFVLHVNVYLKGILTAYGAWTYALLFFIIFMETGFVITPFLPGDSLIFAAGALAPTGSLNVFVLYLLFALAAIGGDNANYWIGHAIGERAFTGEIRWIKKEYMDRAHAFFEKHGGMAIILGRFVPIIRTFVPFVTGISEMPYGQFIRWDVTGGLFWVALFLTGGYTLGNNVWVQAHFSVVIVMIVLISVVPAIYEGWKARNESKKVKPQTKTEMS
jgi:membrane-associated protein